MAKTENESWKEITYLKGKFTKRYAVSTKGRLASFDNNITDLMILNPKLYDNMFLFTIRNNKKTYNLHPHVAVATIFLKKLKPTYKFIIHLDYNKFNNDISNLKWATSEEYFAHRKANPSIIPSLKALMVVRKFNKVLDDAKVTELKKELWDPKRKITLSKLAQKYAISENSLYRIQRGVFWYRIHVDGEPMHDTYKKYMKNLALYEKVLSKEESLKTKLIAERQAAQKKAIQLKKQLEVEKKERYNALIKKRKDKAIARLAMDKKQAERAKQATKVKAALAKRHTDFMKKKAEWVKINAAKKIAVAKRKEIRAKKASIKKAKQEKISKAYAKLLEKAAKKREEKARISIQKKKEKKLKKQKGKLLNKNKKKNKKKK